MRGARQGRAVAAARTTEATRARRPGRCVTYRRICAAQRQLRDLTAQSIKPQAKVLADARDIACVEVDYDELRGIESAVLKLF